MNPFQPVAAVVRPAAGRLRCGGSGPDLAQAPGQAMARA